MQKKLEEQEETYARYKEKTKNYFSKTLIEKLISNDNEYDWGES